MATGKVKDMQDGRTHCMASSWHIFCRCQCKELLNIGKDNWFLVIFMGNMIKDKLGWQHQNLIL
jgi:hypothetical protein